jgi:hypothetical protein
LMRAFPEVVYIDGTHKTNKENRPLITRPCYNNDTCGMDPKFDHMRSVKIAV